VGDYAIAGKEPEKIVVGGGGLADNYGLTVRDEKKVKDEKVRKKGGGRS